MGAPGLSLKQQTAKNAKAAKKAALVSLESRRPGPEPQRI